MYIADIKKYKYLAYKTQNNYLLKTYDMRFTELPIF